MTTLSVHRLTTTLLDAPGGGADARRVDRMMHAVADRELAARLHRLSLPAGEWCVRRVDTSVDYDPRTHETTTQATWADTVVDALCRALEDEATGSFGDVVHYASVRDAVVDMVSSLAVGSTDRAWAWQQLGLVDTTDPEPRPAVLTALCRRPELVLAVLRRLLGSAWPPR